MVNKVTILSVLEPLLYSQEFMHLADISRKLKTPHTTLRIHLNNLEKLNVTTKQLKGRLTMYKLNYANPMIEDFIQLAEKWKLVNRCQKEMLLKEIVQFIHENLKDSKALIFGSAVEDIKKANDVDLLIIGKSDVKDKIKLLEKKLNIEFHIIGLKELNEISLGLKNEIISKHMIINGTEEFVRWMLK